jgi:hypothetical protein
MNVPIYLINRNKYIGKASPLGLKYSGRPLHLSMKLQCHRGEHDREAFAFTVFCILKDIINVILNALAL